jgi:pimeloyl-ACP methyl ester carboxylesterase
VRGSVLLLWGSVSFALLISSLLQDSYCCFMAGFTTIISLHLLPAEFQYFKACVCARRNPKRKESDQDQDDDGSHVELLERKSSPKAKCEPDSNEELTQPLHFQAGDPVLCALLVFSLVSLAIAVDSGVPEEILPSAGQIVVMCLLVPVTLCFKPASFITRFFINLLAILFLIENGLYIHGNVVLRANSAKILEDGPAANNSFKYFRSKLGVAVKCDVSSKSDGYETFVIDSGLAFSAFAFERVLANISSPLVRICALDRPGYALSTNTGLKSPRTASVIGGEILSVIETIQEEKLASKKVTVVGWSLGALNAAYAAFLRPDLINKIILLSPLHPDFFDKLDGFSAQVAVGIASFTLMKVGSPFGLPRFGCATGIWPSESGSPTADYHLSAKSYEQLTQIYCGRHLHNAVAKELSDMKESCSQVKSAIFTNAPSSFSEIPLHVVVEDMDQSSVIYQLAQDWANVSDHSEFTQWTTCETHYIGIMCSDMFTSLFTKT